MPQLDGLRAVAVGVVFIEHWVSAPKRLGIPWGVLGVQLFFVISGFLITGILLDGRENTMASSSSIARRFYLRRVLRIFPAFYAAIMVTYFGGVQVVRDSVWWHLGYLSNVYFFLLGKWHGAVSHFWTLAVEEQFYIVWPWLILVLPRKLLWVMLWVVILTAPVSRIALGASSASPVSFEVLPFSALDTLGIGALVAVLARGRVRKGRAEAFARYSFLVGFLMYLAPFVLGHTRYSQVLTAFQQTFLGLVYASVVFTASKGFRGWLGYLLELPLLRALGRISYGLYLWHNFAPLALSRVVTALSIPPNVVTGPLRVGLLLGLTLCFACASWFIVERPMSKMKRYVPYLESTPSSRTMQRYGTLPRSFSSG
jgi:peptidoglycan/LPS O-acetylase OafA/YrhL